MGHVQIFKLTLDTILFYHQYVNILFLQLPSAYCIHALLYFVITGEDMQINYGICIDIMNFIKISKGVKRVRKFTFLPSFSQCTFWTASLMIQTNLTSSPILTLICGSSSTMNRGGNFLKSDKRLHYYIFSNTHYTEIYVKKKQECVLMVRRHLTMQQFDRTFSLS